MSLNSLEFRSHVGRGLDDDAAEQRTAVMPVLDFENTQEHDRADSSEVVPGAPHAAGVVFDGVADDVPDDGSDVGEEPKLADCEMEMAALAKTA